MLLCHEDCDASTKLMDHLYDAGFFNVVEYRLGLKEWFSKSKPLFDDAADEEEDEEEERRRRERKKDIDFQTMNLQEGDEESYFMRVLNIHKLQDDEVFSCIIYGSSRDL